jgi:hypothetical protein
MPYYEIRERWTPLKLVGIRFYRDDKGGTWVKVLHKPRRLLHS